MPARRLATVTASLLVALGLTVVPAEAGLAVPVDCSHGTVELRWDDATYELDGTCGVVKVLADGVVARVPTATRVVVRGQGNTVVTRSVDTLVVGGRHQEVRPTAVRVLRVAAPRSTVSVTGLVESARLGGRRTTLTAARVYAVKAPGAHNTLRTGRGYDATVSGNGNTLRYQRLDALVVSGDDNSVGVSHGRTSVRNTGRGNRIRVHRD